MKRLADSGISHVFPEACPVCERDRLLAHLKFTIRRSEIPSKRRADIRGIRSDEPLIFTKVKKRSKN